MKSSTTVGVKARNVRDWMLVLVLALVPIWTVWGMIAWFVDTTISRPASDSPGPEWVHDRGSIYWTCTSDGHALIKDTDTGSTMLARDDRKCDAGG